MTLMLYMATSAIAMSQAQAMAVSGHTATFAVAATDEAAVTGETDPEPAVAAQTAPPPEIVPAGPQGQAEDIGDIVVTGSRVGRQGFDAPTPTAVIGEEALAQRSPTTIAEALNDIPAFTPAVSTTTSTFRPFAPGANYANLRGLGAIRTLTLVDGRRFVPSVPTFSIAGANQVDLNLIPMILLQRAEVVTGGASAGRRCRRTRTPSLPCQVLARRTSILPVFAPLNSAMNASGAFSRPSTTVSRSFTFPSRIQPRISSANSGKCRRWSDAIRP